LLKIAVICQWEAVTSTIITAVAMWQIRNTTFGISTIPLFEGKRY
jgi:hypothetical protein